MKKATKRILAFLLALMVVLPVLAGCQNSAGGNETTEPTQKNPLAGKKSLSVLTLGHSLAEDSAHMLNLVANAEGYAYMLVGTLYYSGCTLEQHAQYSSTNAAEYDLYISSTDNPNTPPAYNYDVTMQEALTYEKWDVIIMQAGVFEAADGSALTNGNIQKIQKYVKENCKNSKLIFGWNMFWAAPTDNDLRAMYPNEPNTYITRYEQFDDDRIKLYNAITKCVSDNILTDETFQLVIPTGTAMQNALSSYLEEKDLHRDFVHASDLGRLIAAYTYYCRLAGVDQLEEIKVDTVPRTFFKSTPAGAPDWVLTDAEKALVLECVNNALKNPLQVTQSQYTEKPAQ